MATTTAPKIPQGRLKMLKIADIDVGERFREDFGNLDDLANSIREKGVLQPITVSTEMKLLAGERRIRAATLAGLFTIPALVRSISDSMDAREIELMENVFRKNFTWAEECALIRELDSMYKKNNLDWSGRKTAELLGKGVASVARALQLARAVESMPELGEVKTADEALKIVKKVEENLIVKALRSRHQGENGGLEKGIHAMLRRADANYIIGDTFEGLTELRSNGNIHIIECDPPYAIDLAQVKASKDSESSNVHSYNEIPKKAYPEFLTKIATETFRVAGPNCWLVFWFGPTWQHEVLTALCAAGWLVDEIPCIWAKIIGQTLQPELYLARTYEPFYLARKGNPYLAKRGRSNVFNFPGLSKKYHPTERPVVLIQEILETLGVAQNIVLVPFLGSGATIRAAYNAGMLSYGWDKNDEYKDHFMLAIEDDARMITQEDDDE